MITPPGYGEQIATRLTLQFAPDLIRTKCEWNILCPFADGLSSDPCFAVRRAKRVRRGRRVDANDTRTALRELVARRTSHRAETDDDNVGSHTVEVCNRKGPGVNC